MDKSAGWLIEFVMTVKFLDSSLVEPTELGGQRYV